MNRATCVQCHRQMDNTVYDKGFAYLIHVCTYSDCPNYGLLAITQEKMPKDDRQE